MIRAKSSSQSTISQDSVQAGVQADDSGSLESITAELISPPSGSSLTCCGAPSCDSSGGHGNLSRPFLQVLLLTHFRAQLRELQQLACLALMVVVWGCLAV